MNKHLLLLAVLLGTLAAPQVSQAYVEYNFSGHACNNENLFSDNVGVYAPSTTTVFCPIMGHESANLQHEMWGVNYTDGSTSGGLVCKLHIRNEDNSITYTSPIEDTAGPTMGIGTLFQYYPSGVFSVANARSYVIECLLPNDSYIRRYYIQKSTP